MPDLRVTALYSYPVKGAAGVAHAGAEIGHAGIVGDRTFLVVDGDGVFRTQRTDPRLALIRPRLHDAGAAIELAAPGTGPITIAVDRAGPRRPVRLFSTMLTGIDQGDAVAAWISAVLDVPCRLVVTPPEHDRVTDGAVPSRSGYADSSALHLLSEESLADLDARLPAPLPVARFRPNIVVAGAGAYAEDAWRDLAVGGVALAWTKLAVRCAVTLVDPASGRRAGPEPLRTLARHRRGPDRGVVLGTKFAVVRPGTVRVGDPVTVIDAALPATAGTAGRSPARPAAAG